MLRKSMAVLLGIVAGLGLLLCLVGLAGVWVVNAPLTDAVGAAAQAVDGYLGLATQTLGVTEEQVTALRTELGDVRARLDTVTEERRSDALARVGQRVGPALDTVRTTVAGVHTAIVALNHSLETANRIPSVNVPTLTDELQVADQRIEEMQSGLSAVTAALGDITVDGSEVSAMLDTLLAQLASFGDVMNRAQTQIAGLTATVRVVESESEGWIDLGSVVLSALFILFGAGQAGLIARAVDLFRTAAKLSQPDAKPS